LELYKDFIHDKISKALENYDNYLATPLYFETPREKPLLFLQIISHINSNCEIYTLFFSKLNVDVDSKPSQ